MSNPSFSTRPLSRALSVILPTAEQTLLLRACLSPGELARQAWEEWRSRSKEPGDGFIGHDRSIKKLHLLVFNALQRHGLQADGEAQTYLRSAYLREELRSHIFRRICHDVLLLITKERFSAIVLKGTALAETVYGNPMLRHCHDIDILLPQAEMSRAAALLTSLGFRAVSLGAEPGSDHLKMEHESDLPVELHTRLFEVPYYNVRLSEIRARTQSQVIAGVPAQILTPADNLLHVCGHASYSCSRQSLRWVSDAWFIIDRHPHLDWDLLLDCARRSHLALPLSVSLGYLAENLNAPIPSTFLSCLFAAGAKPAKIERELALRGARATHRRLTDLFQRTMNWRERAFLIQWLLFPSPSYLFFVDRIHHSWLPFHYVYRPLRYVGCRLLSKFKGLIRLFSP